ncbi:MAG: flagellar biosynthetic protein FliR [Verrucomicrobia bacterium]|nr:flagellar biosynthetic protein FliR [Verrucomicrobiota bacterium]
MELFFTWFLVFVRTAAFLYFFPLFSGGNVPARLRISLAGMFSILIASSVQNPVDLASFQVVQVVFLIFQEVSIGLYLSMSTRLIFYGIQLAGHFMSTEMGLQTSTLITPADSIPVAIPAAVLNMLAIMLFLSLDIHHMLILTFQRTYDVLPIGGAVLSNPLFDDMTLRAGRLFLLGVQIAAPLIAISFLLNVVLMMLGRAVPQMNIFFESFTIRLMSGLIVFGVSISLASQRIADELRRLPQNLIEAGRLLSGH